MEIGLKNGEELILEVSPLLLEYIEDYKGGIEQLKKMLKGEWTKMDIQEECMQQINYYML